MTARQTPARVLDDATWADLLLASLRDAARAARARESYRMALHACLSMLHAEQLAHGRTRRELHESRRAMRATASTTQGHAA